MFLNQKTNNNVALFERHRAEKEREIDRERKKGRKRERKKEREGKRERKKGWMRERERERNGER